MGFHHVVDVIESQAISFLPVGRLSFIDLIIFIEYVFLLFFRYSDAVIPDFDNEGSSFLIAYDGDVRCFTTVLYSVIE